MKRKPMSHRTPRSSADGGADDGSSRPSKGSGGRWLTNLLALVAVACVPAVVLLLAHSGRGHPSPDAAAVGTGRGVIDYPTGKSGVVAATQPLGTVPSLTGASVVDPTAGLSLAFNSSFKGTSLSRSIWNTCYPKSECTNYGNSNELEWYRPSADIVSGGVLHLVATKTPTNGSTALGKHKVFAYRSGMITTKKSFHFTYGYVQVVARIPGGTGTWPALWLLPESTNWPPEIDIMENFGAPNSIRTTYFGGRSNAPVQTGQSDATTSDLTSSFHTYGLLWKPGSLTWYLDGVVVDTFTGKSVSHVRMYFLANLAIDGPAASGSSFDIRSVKIYS